MAEKRSRSSNWTMAMKELLVEAARPLADIIDSKLNDGKSLKAKAIAWQNIATTFQASGFELTPKQIRDRWSRYKQEARTNLSQFNRSQRETGGGKPPKEPSEIDYEIAEISALDFVEDTAEFDCDAIWLDDVDDKENIPSSSNPPEPEPETKNSPPPPPKTICKNPRKRARKCPTLGTSEELLQKRIAQVEMETKKKEIILGLQEGVLRKKLEVQERKLHLVNLKIKAEEDKVE
ncbi:uncharacterized protein LOC129941397 [Eupeodes corollae]|uniref:uncharacterized protein LOC129941397 n=1 Tax=Eupeodes corollae TaxID=290404 RepID=UPI002491006D|nr:uncharacterized protein LOC129941397 [Eupeodes corollae]